MSAGQSLDYEERLAVTEDILNEQYPEIEGPYTAENLLDAVGDVFDVSSEDTIHRYMDELMDRGRPVTEEWVDGKKAYKMAFDTSYTEKSQLDEKMQADFISGEVTGYNKQVLNERHDDKEPLRVLLLPEIPFGKKYYNQDMMDGLAHELEALKDEHGAEYFDEDNFLTVFTGDPIPEIPFFHSKNREDAMIALDQNPYHEEYYEDMDLENGNGSTPWEKLQDEEFLSELLQEENLMKDDEELDEYVSLLQDRLDDEVDPEYIAKKIKSVPEAADFTRRELEKLEDAVGGNLPLYIASGEETRKNHEALKDIRVFDYTEKDKEDRKNIEEVTDKITTLEKNIRELDAAVEEETDDLQEYLEEEKILDLGPEDLEDYETYDEYQEVVDSIENLQAEIRAAENSANAMRLEKAVAEAMGERATMIFGKRYIEPDAADILDRLTYHEFKEAIHSVGNVKDIWRDKELGEIEKNGWRFHVSHNLNQESDTTMKYGFAEGLRAYLDKEVDKADVFVQGHHNEHQRRHVSQGRGLDSDYTTAIQNSTLADKELIEKYGEDLGLNDWWVKRKHKGIHDESVHLLELDVEEDDEGLLHKTIRKKSWGGQFLKKLGEQLNGKETVKDYTVKQPMHFEVTGDRHVSEPDEMKNPAAYSSKELIKKEALWQSGRRPDDRIILDVGDMIEGVNVYNGQGSEAAPHGSRDRHLIEKEITESLEELGREDLVDDAIEFFHEANLHQLLNMNLGEQFREVDEELGMYYDWSLENGAELYLWSGNHGNRSSRDNYFEESAFAELMLDRDHRGMGGYKDADVEELFDWDETATDSKVHTFDGNRDADGYVTFDGSNWEAYVTHTPHGRGKTPIKKTINEPVDPDTRLVVAGHLHDGSEAHKDGTLFLETPSNAPTNGLSVKIGDTPRVPGIISDVVLDRDGEKDYYEVEFFFPGA